MSAKELLCKLDGSGQMWVEGATDAEEEAILRALRLLAAAEANDGTTAETDARVDYEIRAGISLGESAIYDIARTLERERNGLAARVVDLEPDAERYRCVRDMEHGDLEAINDASCSPEEFDAAIDAARIKP